MTLGLLVFVQLVMAAITTAPSVILEELPLSSIFTAADACALPNVLLSDFFHSGNISFSRMRS